MEGTSLNDSVEQRLAEARASSAGRSAVTVHGGREHDLRQTLIALAALPGVVAGRHDLTALTDAAVLLTVATRATPR